MGKVGNSLCSNIALVLSKTTFPFPLHRRISLLSTDANVCIQSQQDFWALLPTALFLFFVGAVTQCSLSVYIFQGAVTHCSLSVYVFQGAVTHCSLFITASNIEA